MIAERSREETAAEVEQMRSAYALARVVNDRNTAAVRIAREELDRAAHVVLRYTEIDGHAALTRRRIASDKEVRRRLASYYMTLYKHGRAAFAAASAAFDESSQDLREAEQGLRAALERDADVSGFGRGLWLPEPERLLSTSALLEHEQ